MRYFEIGQRVRRYRKACGLSQKALALAGRVGISVTHMSHIETGNTKLSLPVLTKIAEELSVSVDTLLTDTSKPDKAALSAEAQVPLHHAGAGIGIAGLVDRLVEVSKSHHLSELLERSLVVRLA